MIAKLTGRLDSRGAGWAVLDVGGVGYLVEASARTLDAIAHGGADVPLATLGGADVGASGSVAASATLVTVYTQMQVSQDAMRLLAFATPHERESFRALVNIQGVGSKVALAILSVLDLDALALAVNSGDSAMIARANGVGAKLAARICNELKGKLDIAAPALSTTAGGGGVVGLAASGQTPDIAADALAALIGLGFRPAEAYQATAAAIQQLGDVATLDEVIRHALKHVARH